MNNIFDRLLEPNNPSVRYFSLRHLLDRSEDDPEVLAARRAIMGSEPVQKILAAQNSAGYWSKPGKGYSPKYQATSWQLLFLSELGADGENEQVRKGCEYFLGQSPTKHGGFDPLVYCLNGNMLWALTQLGVADDERFGRALDWTVGMIIGDLPHTGSYTWPGYVCGVNDKLTCTWGAVKALRALVNLPHALQTPKVKRAITAGVDLLFSRDPATADYPVYERVSSEWFKFGFPLSYTSDVLELCLGLCEAGYGRDPRLKNAVDLILSKRQPDGRWLLKHSLNGKMWADIEAKGKPSKWITLRALQVLKATGMEAA